MTNPLWDTAERMAGLAEKRGPVHPWWALAEATLTLLEYADPDTIKLVTEQFNKRVKAK